MLSYLLRRILSGLFIVWGVYTLTFFAVNLAPGDPFTAKENPKVQEDDLLRLRKAWGYDRPVPERYLLHMRKMFWADPQTVEVEGGGIQFEVRGDGGANRLSAKLQQEPDEIRLVPTKRSAADDGALEVTVRRGPEGWADAPIKKGRYTVGLRPFLVGDAPVTLDTVGVTLRAEGGTLHVRRSRTDAPERLTLARPTAPAVTLERAADGSYGPLVVEGDAYTFSDPSTSSPVGISVPSAPLDDGGLTFDLGSSISHGTKVMDHLRAPLLNTLILACAAMLVEFLLGVLLGVISAVMRGTWLDRGMTLGSLFVYSMPGFWLAVMLQLLFSIKLGWLPIASMHDVGDDGIWDLLEHMVMPVFVLGVALAASMARYQRSALLEVMGQDYIRTARAKGLSERKVIWRHALRNALAPTITILGLSLPFLVSGAVITEQIFSWPGMGREAILAIAGRDVTVVTGITLIATVMVVLGSLLADLLYALVDPRVRVR